MTKVVLHGHVQGHLDSSAEARDVLLEVCRAHNVPVHWHEATDTVFISAPLHGKTIVIDAGHGGQDRYQTGRLGLVEADFVQLVANELAARLTAAGANVVRTRNADETVVTPIRQAMVAQAEPWAVVSLHVGNRVRQRGAAAYIRWSRLYGSWRLARAVLGRIAETTALPALGVRLYAGQGAGREGYQVLTAARCPAVVFELGQLPSVDDEAVLRQPGIAADLAACLLDGLLALAGHRPRSGPALRSGLKTAAGAAGMATGVAETVAGAAAPAGAVVSPPVSLPPAAVPDPAAALAAETAPAGAPGTIPATAALSTTTGVPVPITTAPGIASHGGQATVVTSGLLDVMKTQRPQMSAVAQAIRAGQPPPPPTVKNDAGASIVGPAVQPVQTGPAQQGQLVQPRPPALPGQARPPAMPGQARPSVQQSQPRPPAVSVQSQQRPPMQPPITSQRQPFR